MDNLIIVTTAFSDRDEAVKVAEVLLKLKFVACAQISQPVESLYWWKNEIERSDEYLLTLKTKDSLYKQVESSIKKIHSYETPEIIGVRVSHVDSDYEKWLCEEVCKDLK